MERIKILHITNDFSNSSLYKQLVLHLDSLGIDQTIYSAVRSKKELLYDTANVAHMDIKIRNILNYHDRILFRLKIRKIFKDLRNQIDISHIDLVHAHTLYSDGAVAFKIKKEFGIPYVVAIRNTAVNIFHKYRPDLKGYKNKILDEAEKVIFISPAYHNKFLTSLNKNLKRKAKNKLITIPNGINPVFLNSSRIEKKSNSVLKVLYVGKFIRRKNVYNLIKAIKILEKRYPVQLTLVGGEGHDFTSFKLKKYVLPKENSTINYLGQVTNIEKLREIYTSHDVFIMVSYHETFGLVYIEALSQGLPIIYVNEEGVDGYFNKSNVGEAVIDITNPVEIAEKIEKLANRLNENLKRECMKEAQHFNWNDIAIRYKKLYDSVLLV